MTFVKQEKIYSELKDGDLILNGSPDWEDHKTKRYFKQIKKEDLKSKYLVHIENFGHSTLDIIKKLDLNVEFWKQFEYRCPFNKSNHMSVVPMYICVDDISRFEDVVPEYRMHMLKDKEFLNDLFEIDTPHINLGGFLTR